jgi:hypothetical protein
MSVNERKILNLRRLKIEKNFQYFSKTFYWISIELPFVVLLHTGIFRQ